MKPSALQAAVLGVLSGDATLVAFLSDAWGETAIFSIVPQVDEAGDDDYFPYMSFGPEISLPFDTKTFSGAEATVQINIWSRQNDYIEVKDIADRVHALLHKQALTISGHTHVETYFETSEVSDDPDGKTRRCRMQFAINYY